MHNVQKHSQHFDLKFICFLGGGDCHIVGFLKVYRKFISWAVARLNQFTETMRQSNARQKMRHPLGAFNLFRDLKGVVSRWYACVSFNSSWLFLNPRKRVRCTQGNLHNSRFIVRDAGVVYVRFYKSPYFIFILWYSSDIYMLQPIKIRLTTLSCFETNIYLRVFSRTHASKPFSDR